MAENDINQKSGNNSTNLQIIYQGVSAAEARQISLDVFTSNFYRLSQIAAEIAKARAEEISYEFIERAFKINTDTSLFQDPAVQYSIFNAQAAYAKYGDNNIKELLIATLLERLQKSEHNFDSIVLDESIIVLSKITKNICHL